MKSRIILTDIHGCFKTLTALIAKLPVGVPLTFAGDLIDRGPDSCKVIEFVKNGGYDCVVGNHEVMMLDELWFGADEKGEFHVVKGYNDGIWLMNGGDKCLDSYSNEDGVIDVKTLKAHQQWLQTLPYYIEYPELKNKNGDYLLVTHTTAAGAWEELDHNSPRFKSEVTWNRPYGYPPKIEGIYSVYGHTPQKNKVTIKEHFANIDTGACYKRSPYGKLSALQFPEMIVYEQENVEE